MDTIHIPTEIVNEIVDHLPDRPSLLDCALISKSWAFSCRRHIFRDVELSLDIWHESIPAVPNGPHLHTRTLKINDEDLGSIPFLQHFLLFSNLGSLSIYYPTWALETISLPNTFGHLTPTLRSLSFSGLHCSSQTLMSLVTLFPHLESLQLSFIYVDDLESPCPPPEQQTFKGSLIDWNSHTEQFYRDLAEHDLQYREMHVSGVDWLLDTPYNTCLVKCSERLESFGIYCGGGLPDGVRYNIPIFKNLRKLLICSYRSYNPALPPPGLFLYLITSTKLAEIAISFATRSFDTYCNQALATIRAYDDVLCKLSDQLESPSPGSNKLILTLKVPSLPVDPNEILPRFNKVGIFKVVCAQ